MTFHPLKLESSRSVHRSIVMKVVRDGVVEREEEQQREHDPRRPTGSRQHFDERRRRQRHHRDDEAHRRRLDQRLSGRGEEKRQEHRCAHPGDRRLALRHPPVAWQRQQKHRRVGEQSPIAIDEIADAVADHAQPREVVLVAAGGPEGRGHHAAGDAVGVEGEERHRNGDAAQETQHPPAIGAPDDDGGEARTPW